MPPGMLANFDQTVASSLEYLNKLVSAYIETRDSDAAAGGPQVLTVVVCAKVLLTECPAETLAGTLATALMVIANLQQWRDCE